MLARRMLTKLKIRKSIVFAFRSRRPLPRPRQVSAGALTFDHVSFAYLPGHVALEDVTWAIRGGGTVAFVGATGSGKSSLLRLL